jgi:chromosome segregation ATPase
LKEQIKEKDLQIRELHKLIENNQVLLKDKPQEIKLLEEHFQDIDSKMMEIKQDMQERKEPQKGLFKRIFRK